jgi:hypothetical protein
LFSDPSFFLLCAAFLGEAQERDSMINNAKYKNFIQLIYRS